MGFVILVKGFVAVDKQDGSALNWYLMFFHLKQRKNSSVSLLLGCASMLTWCQGRLLNDPGKWHCWSVLRWSSWTFVQVIKLIGKLQIHYEVIHPIFHGDDTIMGYVKNPLSPSPSSTVLSDSIMSISNDCSASCTFGILPQNLCNALSNEYFCLKCSFPNTKEPWVIPTHLSKDSLSLPPTWRTDHHGPGSKLCIKFWRLIDGLGNNPSLYALKLHGLGGPQFCPESPLLKAFWAGRHSLWKPSFSWVCSSWDGLGRLFICPSFLNGYGGPGRLFFVFSGHCALVPCLSAVVVVL